MFKLLHSPSPNEFGNLTERSHVAFVRRHACVGTDQRRARPLVNGLSFRRSCRPSPSDLHPIDGRQRKRVEPIRRAPLHTILAPE